MVRATGNVPLKRINDAWEKLYNAENMNPYLSPKKLSRIIREVGVNLAGQNIIFNELDIEGKILILDRGFFSEGTIKFLGGKEGKKISYVLWAKRNSRYYDTRIHLNGYFSYHGRLIRCGKRRYNDFYLYLFEDQDLRLEEQKTLYRKLDEHEIEKEKFNIRMKKAELNHKIPPIDLLFKYSKVYHVNLKDHSKSIFLVC